MKNNGHKPASPAVGLDVLRWIRQQPGMALVVIVLTASGEDADIATAYRLGVNAFLTKPSEASKLEEMVKAIKDFWLTHNTLPRESGGERIAAPVESGAKGLGSRNGRIGAPREQKRTSNAAATK